MKKLETSLVFASNEGVTSPSGASNKGVSSEIDYTKTTAKTQAENRTAFSPESEAAGQDAESARRARDEFQRQEV